MDFTTLGMFIIDEIQHDPGKPSIKDVPGGGGMYAALGARLVSPPPQAKSVGQIVDAGSDFPSMIGDLIKSWQTSCLFREDKSRLTTRGWCGYKGDVKTFKYTTPKLRLDADSLTLPLLASKSFHLVCSPARCVEIVSSILARRHKELSPTLERPVFVWEPMPDSCVPDQLKICLDALKHVNVVSPNHEELCGFYGEKEATKAGEVNCMTIEKCSARWLESGVGQDGKGAIVVRAGAAGCFIRSSKDLRWLPAYHRDANKVVDPTGGGNTFLGGLVVGIVRTAKDDKDGLTKLEEAAAWGSVAASFAIEQLGLPKLDRDAEGAEKWNGCDVFARLDDFKHSLKN